MSENEQWYDSEVAPELQRLCRACAERGMGFISAVEYEHGNWAETRQLPEDASLAMTMISHCVRSAPNIDAYVLGLLRYAKEKNIDLSASMVARRLLSADL